MPTNSLLRKFAQYAGHAAGLDPRRRRPERAGVGVIGDPTAGPGKLVEAWRDRRFALVVSPLLLTELDEVLSRPKFARWAGDGRGAAYVAGFDARSEHQPTPSIRRPRGFATLTTIISLR